MTTRIRAGVLAAILGLALTALGGTTPTFAGCGDDGASLACQEGSTTAPTASGLDAGGN